jgi:ribosomal protein S18 acetylase RimI-like enzyme
MNIKSVQILTVMTEKQLCAFSKDGRIDSVCKRLTELVMQISPGTPPVRPMTLVSFFKQCGVLVVAYDTDNCILGMGTLVLTCKLTGNTARIEHVVVDEKFRGQHMSSKILSALLEAASAEQVRYTDLTTGPDRIPANALYLKFGFKKRDTNCYRLTGRV